MTKTALIGLDYIVDIMHPDGKIARSAAHAAQRGIVAKANHALRIAKDRGWLSVLVEVAFAPNYADQPRHSPMFGRVHELGAIRLGSPGTEFHPDLDASLADLVIVKPRVSGFHSTQLEAALRARGIERLVIAGVSSTWAVQSTVRDAHDRDYEVLVLEDACAAADDAEHQASMQQLAGIARIISVDGLADI